MKVVEADSSFAGYLSEFGGRAFIHAYQCTLPIKELKEYIDVAFAESTILAEINGSSETYFICQDADLNPCGYAKLILSPAPKCIGSNSCIELQRLYIDSDYRGQGVGKLLESHAESHASDLDIQDIWLRVWEGNEIAQEIYINWGFTIVGEEPYQVGKEKRTVRLMSKPLSSG